MILTSFSGIDGAGKSTQIASLQARLQAKGASVRRLTFWDDVVVFRPLREWASRALLKGDPGVGSPERPVNRRDKNVSTWYLLLARIPFACFDLLHLRWIVSRARRANSEVVIFDRYIYDELANLPLERSFVRVMVGVLLKFVPKPDVACLLDADPLAARVRKPEYPLEFLAQNRRRYLLLASLASEITVIDPLLVPEVEERVFAALSSRFQADEIRQFSSALS